MGLISKFSTLIVFALAIGGIALWYFGADLQNVTIEHTEIENVRVSPYGFTLEGVIVLKNPSRLSVPVKNIDYYIILEDTKEVIASGTSPSFMLEKETTTPVFFSQDIKWAPTSQLAITALTKDKVLITIKGYASVDIPKLDIVALPFEHTIDIKPYTDEFLNKYVPASIQQIIRDAVNSTLYDAFSDLL